MKKIALIGAAAAIALTGLTSFAIAETAKPDRAQMRQNFCTDMYARQVSKLTYLETKLAPTAAQKPAWEDYKSTVQSTAKANESKCLSGPRMVKEDGKRPSILEKRAMQVKFLEARLETLKATEAPLTALYATLTDEQKQTLDRSDRRGGKGFGRHGGGRGHWGGHDRGDRNKPQEN